MGTSRAYVVYAKDVKAVTASISQGAGDAASSIKLMPAAGDAVQISAVTPADSHDPVIYPIGIIKKYDNSIGKRLLPVRNEPRGPKGIREIRFLRF